MFKQEHPHFVTGNFKPQGVYLGDDEYGRALDCLVKACTDLLLLDSDEPHCKLLLGKRIVEPQPDWWYFTLFLTFSSLATISQELHSIEHHSCSFYI
jgi:hypothetical protein